LVPHARNEEALASMEATRRAAGPVFTTEALEFIRFCYRRRRIGWPELYDEMCAVAGRGLYQGWGPEELAAAGIGLTLFEMPAVAALAARVIAEEIAADREREAARRAAASAGSPGGQAEVVAAADAATSKEPRRSMRLVPGAI
jgi:hypothetical protein